VKNYKKPKIALKHRAKNLPVLKSSELNENWFRTTLYSIGDGVITTDKRGCILQMNPVAEKLTGWKESDAKGKGISKVFHIINELTRKRAVNPVRRILREGIVIGLANHTVLISRSGKEYPIADAGSPIRDDNGKIVGAVLVFRDQSAERQAQHEIRKARDYATPVWDEKEKRIVRIYGASQDITKQKAAEQAIREREEWFRKLADTTSTAIFIYQEDKFVYVNRATQELTGYSEKELLSMNFWDVVHPEHRELVRQRGLARQHGAKLPGRYQIKIINKDGTERWIDLTAGKIDWQGKPAGIGTAFDITDIKQSETALRQSEQLLRTFLNSTSDFVFLKDNNFRHLLANNSLCNFYGKNEKEIIGKTDFDLMPEKNALECRRSDEQALNTKNIVITEEFVRGQYFETLKFPVKLSDKEWGVGGFIRNITAQKEIEKEITLLAHAIKSISDCVSITDMEDKILYVNNAFLKTYGYQEDELIGKNISIVRSDKNSPEIVKQILAATKLGGWEGELINKRKDGSEFYVRLSTSVVRDTKGSPIALIGVSTDITEKKKAEEEIKSLHQQYERFFLEDLTGDYISTPEGKIITCNPAFIRMFGFANMEEALATNMATLFHSHEERARLLSRLQREKKLEYIEIEMMKRDGTPIYIVANIIGRFDKDDHLIEIQGYLFDDTKRRQLEEGLRHAQKLESLGTLASGIAHDFNNVLGIILGHATLLERVHANPEKFAQSIDAITSATQRGASLVKQMLTFARKTEVVFQPLELNILVKEVAKMLRETFPKTIEVETSITKDLPPINGDPTQIHQILLNLCVNARDAMPKGGTLTITTEIIDAHQIATKFPNLNSQRYILLSVTDTGIGMDKATLNRIFEPFFTTKAPGFGTGLGLSVVHGIVSSHGGFIDVKSSLGKGTTFYVYLPAAQRTVLEYQSSKKDAEEAQGGTETILIIEDEELLRELLQHLLISKGYKVISAKDGLQGVEIYKENYKNISLVISDLGLPKLSGEDVFKQIKQFRPEAKVILASGFIEPELKSQLMESGVKILYRNLILLTKF
jgi:two-component system cell cycle sensor histidine kinase/response regulator CckA